MYSTYSPFQQQQLAEQPYQDTQRTWLAVYGPARCPALAASMELQLHRKFQLTAALDELPDGLDGVVVASEDAECLSTTLSYFAAALQQGADFAFCDAVFGFEGDTLLYRAAARPQGARCAVLSRGLLARCRAAARDPDDPAWRTAPCTSPRPWSATGASRRPPTSFRPGASARCCSAMCWT